MFDSRAENLEIDNAKAMSSLEEGCSYTFLGVLETVKQEDRIVPQNAAKVYLQRLSIIWSIPLTDYHRVAASKQYVLPVLTYSCGPRHGHLPTYSSWIKKGVKLSWTIMGITPWDR